MNGVEKPRKPIAGLGSGLSLLILVVPFLAGCDAMDDPGPDGAFVVRDSLGVEFVENHAPLWAEGESWSIDPEFVVQIGEVEGEPAYQFAAIWDATRLPDGRIVVVDSRSREVRLFGADGEHLVSFGRPGEGPGEFGATPFVAVRAPDTILVWDGGNYRLSRYLAGGDLLEERSLRSRLQEASVLGTGGWTVGTEGGLVAHEFRMGSGEGDRRDSRVEFFLIQDPAENVISLGSFPSNPQLRVEDQWIGSPFAPAARVALGPAPLPVALAHGEAWEVALLDPSGAVQRVVRAPIPRRPIPPDLMREQRAQWAERMSLSPGQVEDAWRTLGPTDSIPAVGHLTWDAAGNLWVGRRTEELGRVSRFDVFNAQGRWLGTVTIPEELAPLSTSNILEIGDDHLLVTWLGEMGVQYVRQYRILKPG